MLDDINPLILIWATRSGYIRLPRGFIRCCAESSLLIRFIKSRRFLYSGHAHKLFLKLCYSFIAMCYFFTITSGRGKWFNFFFSRLKSHDTVQMPLSCNGNSSLYICDSIFHVFWDGWNYGDLQRKSSKSVSHRLNGHSSACFLNWRVFHECRQGDVRPSLYSWILLIEIYDFRFFWPE